MAIEAIVSGPAPTFHSSNTLVRVSSPISAPSNIVPSSAAGTLPETMTSPLVPSGMTSGPSALKLFSSAPAAAQSALPTCVARTLM